MKTIFSFIFALFLFNQAYTGQLKCDPKLQRCMISLQKLPEVKQLIEQILREGDLTLAVQNSSLSDEFGAFWDMDNRIIFVSNVHNKSDGALIGSILFELQNARVNSEYEHLDRLASRKQISKARYVEAYEHIEYLNSINASNMAKKGIALGIFPKNSGLPVYKNFAEHFYYQRISGHSDCIARNFDQLK